MDPYQETFETWNNLASQYQEKFMNLDLYNQTYDYFCRKINKPKAKVLEIGCGPGNITQYLLKKRPDFEILGIDIAPKMIELARINNPSANFEIMDSRKINELKTQYDGIISGFCLPYLSQKEGKDLISNCYNLLNKSGVLYLSFVEGNPDQSNFKSGTGGRVFFYFHDLNDLIKELTLTRFEEIQTFRVQYNRTENQLETHTILTAVKSN